MSYRVNASFGKREEFAAIAELIRRGYDTYKIKVPGADPSNSCRTAGIEREPL